jgi:hypothetical protein
LGLLNHYRDRETGTFYAQRHEVYDPVNRQRLTPATTRSILATIVGGMLVLLFIR